MKRKINHSIENKRVGKQKKLILLWSKENSIVKCSRGENEQILKGKILLKSLVNQS